MAHRSGRRSSSGRRYISGNDMSSETDDYRIRQRELTAPSGSFQESRVLEKGELLLFRIFDEYLLLMSESAAMKDRISHFLGSLKTPISNSVRTTTRLAIFEAPNDHVVLCCPECGVAQTVTLLPTAWFVFRRLLLHLVVNMERPHFPLHACCVVNKNGDAAVISGLSGSGKTSVTAALLRRGYHFAVDDYAMLLPDGFVLAFPLGSTISQRTFTLLPDIEPLKSPLRQLSNTDSGIWIANLGQIFPIVKAFTLLRPTHFFFLMPGFGAQSSLEPCSTEESLWHLQAARLADRRMVKPLKRTSPKHYDMGLGIAQKLVHEAGFFRVVNGDLNTTAALIAAAFESDPR